jgi:hypothetical protein
MTHRVFLSSTFVDLTHHRASVQAGLRQLGAIDVSMENFGARDERPVEECLRLVKQESDIFVGIYAHRYGYIPDESPCSISELEYRTATEAKLPRFLYLIDDDQPWLPAHIDSGDQKQRLDKFKAALKKHHICQTFGSQDQLATKVVADVARHIAFKATKKVGPGIPVDDIGIESLRGPVFETPDEWNMRRHDTYEKNRKLFLTHVIQPSNRPGQSFDVFIYLIRHKSQDFSDIRVAEFFLGPYWENRIFPAVERDGFIGISTAAYGTFLCLCRVTFSDGTTITLDRYIDFEAQRTAGAEA